MWGLIESLSGLGSAYWNTSSWLYFNLKRLMVRWWLCQTVTSMRELVDISHQNIVQLLPHLRLVRFDCGLKGYEAESICFGWVGGGLRALFLSASLLVLNYLLFQLLQVRKHRHWQRGLRALLLVSKREQLSVERRIHVRLLLKRRLDVRHCEVRRCFRLISGLIWQIEPSVSNRRGFWCLLKCVWIG